MTRRRAPVVLLWLLGCGGSDQIVGVEDLGDADLKVIITRSAQRADITVLPAGEAYRYRHEPLATIFERGDSLEVIIVGLRSSELKALYAGVPDRAAAELAPLLLPRLGPAEAGVYPGPEPTRVLAATIDSSSGSDLPYRNVTLADLGDSGRYGFALSGASVCPPIDQDFRVYAREDPTKVCVYRRDDACLWARSSGAGACPNEAAIFGDVLPTDRRVFQKADGSLLLPGGALCPKVEIQSVTTVGETHGWQCAGKIVVAQSPPPGGPFAFLVEAVKDIGGTELSLATSFAAGSHGLYAATSDTRMHRLFVDGNTVGAQEISLLRVDSGTTDTTLSRIDDRTAQLLMGSFNSVVRSGMCLSVAGGRAKIETVDSARLTTLQALPIFGNTSAWTIFGPTVEGSGARTSLVLPLTFGGFRRLTVGDDDRLVMFGVNQTFDAEAITGGGDSDAYNCPYPVVVPAGAFDLIARGSGFVALGPTGVSVMAADGSVLRTIDLGGPVPTDARIKILADAMGDLMLVHSPSAVEVVVIRPQDVVTRESVGGEIMAFFSTPPRVLYRPTGKSAELILAQLGGGSAKTYVVPPFDEVDSPTEVEIRSAPEATGTIGGELLVLYAQGTHVGALNLTSGQSRAVPIGPGATARATFRDESGTIGFGYFSSDLRRMVIELGN